MTGNRLGGFGIAALDQHGVADGFERLAVTQALADEGVDRFRQRHVVVVLQKFLQLGDVVALLDGG